MRISWIEAGMLAAGGIPLDQKDVEDLHAQGIRAILALTELPISNQREITPTLLTTLDIEVLHFPIVDQQAPPVERIDEATHFIDHMLSTGRPVYLYCHAGVGRTGTVLHAYYLQHGYNLETTKEKVKAGKFTSQFLMLSAAQQAFILQFAASKLR
ncbi:MAG: dual specificity protein phosphatase family protein [Anaerolineae bacterium]